jgi:hypothetical protein
MQLSFGKKIINSTKKSELKEILEWMNIKSDDTVIKNSQNKKLMGLPIYLKSNTL